ncbi:unnamed protein product [Schistosoma bovis]|uniref:Sperm-associated antigen 8 n=1 Tax=Schistosoma haematobium TaxID=6185 RepID=A0A922LYH7_SCHHA|nr:Sperm-associated antigen 8 [Schistosoma haematobium]CAH8438406.1 unnamed protein product [Schistosoma bovis]KAH9596504.1 Sperm-associated antigen 8 [Schistosoma haematobium]CAH8438424.1 unnamed protein product [Schistosoma bovis]CAH8487032.1 unnamed protein product [Schistosoma haematobium]CAH8488392.1 unnamed protein product [Schistosoma haematobium]
MTLNTQDEYRIRKEDIELYKKIRREVEQEFMAKYEPVDYRSVTKIDFHKDVVRLPPRPEPMGNTHYSTNRTTPFGRNAAFTTPIDQYLNSRMPCEMQVYSR